MSETLIRGTHPYHFRSGEWARLLTVVEAPDPARDCYVVQFGDGVTDFWVVEDDAARYELRKAPRA